MYKSASSPYIRSLGSAAERSVVGIGGSLSVCGPVAGSPPSNEASGGGGARREGQGLTCRSATATKCHRRRHSAPAR